MIYTITKPYINFWQDNSSGLTHDHNQVCISFFFPILSGIAGFIQYNLNQIYTMLFEQKVYFFIWSSKKLRRYLKTKMFRFIIKKFYKWHYSYLNLNNKESNIFNILLLVSNGTNHIFILSITIYHKNMATHRVMVTNKF